MLVCLYVYGRVGLPVWLSFQKLCMKTLSVSDPLTAAQSRTYSPLFIVCYSLNIIVVSSFNEIHTIIGIFLTFL